MKWSVLRYQTLGGKVPFDEFMEGLAAKEKARVLRTVELLETFGTSLHEPYARHLTGSDLWELRVECGANSYRVFYFAWTGHAFVLLSGFSKKGQKTPRLELSRAEKYLKDFRERA